MFTNTTVDTRDLFFKTDSRALAPTLLRVSVAVVLWPHGAQKALGWFGGYGFFPTMDFFTQTVGLPWVVGLCVIALEFFGPLGLLFGLGTRFWGVALGGLMLGAIIWGGHYQQGFFMNWFGNQAGEGFEYHLLFLGAAGALTWAGGGAWAVDSLVLNTLNAGPADALEVPREGPHEGPSDGPDPRVALSSSQSSQGL